MLEPGIVSSLTVGRGHGSDITSVAVLGLFCSTVMSRIMTFCSTVDRTYDCGPILLKVKGKAVPLQAWSGPEGSRKLRSPGFMTVAQDGGQVVSLTHRQPLPPGNAPGTHFC